MQKDLVDKIESSKAIETGDNIEFGAAIESKKIESKSADSIIVFASRWVGLEALKFVLSQNFSALKGVVAGNKNDTEILNLAAQNGVPCCVWESSQNTIAWLENLADSIESENSLDSSLRASHFALNDGKDASQNYSWNDEKMALYCHSERSEESQKIDSSKDLIESSEIEFSAAIESNKVIESSEVKKPLFAWCIHAYTPHIFSTELLECFSHRINLHPSYPPFCLGQDGAAWSIMECEKAFLADLQKDSMKSNSQNSMPLRDSVVCLDSIESVLVESSAISKVAATAREREREREVGAAANNADLISNEREFEKELKTEIEKYGKSAAFCGVCLLEMERKVDAGAVWARRKIDMHFPLRGADNYHHSLEELIKLFKQKWGDIYAGRIEPRKIAIQTIHTRAQTNTKRVLFWEQKASVGEILVNILANDFAPHCTSILRVGKREFALRLDLWELYRRE